VTIKLVWAVWRRELNGTITGFFLTFPNLHEQFTDQIKVTKFLTFTVNFRDSTYEDRRGIFRIKRNFFILNLNAINH